MNVMIKGAERTVKGKMVASLLCSGVPCKLWSLTVFNTTLADQYIQLFDAVALPADGTQPDVVFKVPADYHGSLDVGTGLHFDTGLVICNSSTNSTKTIGGLNCFFTAGVGGQ